MELKQKEFQGGANAPIGTLLFLLFFSVFFAAVLSGLVPVLSYGDALFYLAICSLALHWLERRKYKQLRVTVNNAGVSLMQKSESVGSVTWAEVQLAEFSYNSKTLNLLDNAGAVKLRIPRHAENFGELQAMVVQRLHGKAAGVTRFAHQCDIVHSSLLLLIPFAMLSLLVIAGNWPETGGIAAILAPAKVYLVITMVIALRMLWRLWRWALVIELQEQELVIQTSMRTLRVPYSDIDYVGLQDNPTAAVSLQRKHVLIQRPGIFRNIVVHGFDVSSALLVPALEQRIAPQAAATA